MRPSFTLIGVLLLLLQQGLCASQESRFATVRRLAAARDVLHHTSEPHDLILGSEIARPLFSWDLTPTDISQGQLQSSDVTAANTSDNEDVEKKDKKARGKKKKKKKKKRKQQNNHHIAITDERDDQSAIMSKDEDKTVKAKKTKLDRKKKEKRRRRKEKQEKRKKQEEQRATNLLPIQIEDVEPSKKSRNKGFHKPIVNSSELAPASPASGENDVQRYRKMSTVTDNMEESNSVPLLDPLAGANKPLNAFPHGEKNVAIDLDKGTEIVGDLSCLQGRFLPAPPIEHGVIKYVRGSFLEAEYECEVEYKLEPEGASKLVCREYEWLGQRPSCVSISGTNRTTTICKGCEHLCTLQDGQPKCSCYRGFILKGSTCQDIDECATLNGGCEDLCHNTLGSYHCQCAHGFRLADNGKNCVDINECLLRNGHGPCQDSCENLPGSYRCSCEGLAGTRLSADNHTCEDLDECSRNNAGCSHICLNTLGRAFCLCPIGFMLGSDWKTCNDIDECADPDLQEGELCSIGCINTIGSYHCIDMQDEAREVQPQSEIGVVMTTMMPLTNVSNFAVNSSTTTASPMETTAASTYPTTAEPSTTELPEIDLTTTVPLSTDIPDDLGSTTTAEPTTVTTTDIWETESETTFYTTTEQPSTDTVSSTEFVSTESWFTTIFTTTDMPITEESTSTTSEAITTQSVSTEIMTPEPSTTEMLTTTLGTTTSAPTTTEMLTTTLATTTPTPMTTTTEMLTTTLPTTTSTPLTTTVFTTTTSIAPSTSTTTAPVSCPFGFKISEHNKCEDVNECAIANGGCSHTCYNAIGRAFCLCPPGYMLSSDWKTCKAMEVHTSRPPKVYVACPPGYRANSKGHCKDVDECVQQNGGCSHGCINTRGSYRCVCGRGFFLGADRRTCIKEDLDVVCPPLSTPPNGYLHCNRRVIMAGPERWRARWRRRVINHAGTVCDLRCPHGYKLQGDFHKVCDGSGKWSGPEEGTCIPFLKPKIHCPDNIIAELEPGHEKAFVAFPQPDTNVNWFRDVTSKPHWGKMLEADLHPGQWKVTFTATDPVSHHSSSCTLLITVVGAPG